MAAHDLDLPLDGAALLLADASELDGSRSGGRSLVDELEPGPGWLAASARGAFVAARLLGAARAAVIRVDAPGLEGPREEAVAAASAPLTLPSGRLWLFGGLRALRGDLDEEAVREVVVAPGSYRATLEVLLASAGGLAHLEAASASAGPPHEPIGAYFRRTRPGQAHPDWLAHLLGERPHLDPGHEDAWEDFQQTDRFGALIDAAEGPGLAFVDLVVTLEPEAPCEPPSGGWLDLRTGSVKPARCPLGLPTAVR